MGPTADRSCPHTQDEASDAWLQSVRISGRKTGQIYRNPDLVQKVRRTPSQKKLTAVQRRKNLESAFRVTRKISEKRILLVDDVYTTGSTMDAMAACLKKKGGEKIYFLTLCTGRT